MAAAHLTGRFTDAVAYAAVAHAGQRRKGTDLPYVSHLLSVAALVLDDGKERYVAHIATMAPEARRVSLADKLHNARAILRDYRTHGEAVWDRFSTDGAGPRWYLRALTGGFAGSDSPMAADLEMTVAELERLMDAAGT